MIGSYSSSKGGVTVDVELTQITDIPVVEQVLIQTGEYVLALTERKDIEYSDFAIPLDEFKETVQNLVRILAKIEKEIDDK
jgi:hypothetical protein